MQPQVPGNLLVAGWEYIGFFGMQEVPRQVEQEVRVPSQTQVEQEV